MTKEEIQTIRMCYEVPTLSGTMVQEDVLKLCDSLERAQAEIERLRKRLNHIGFYFAGTDFDNVSKYVLKVLEGTDNV